MRLTSSRLRVVTVVLAAASLVTACSSSAATPTAAPAGTGTPVAATVAATTAATAAPSTAANWGLTLSKSCTGDCVTALQLKADPGTVTCKVGLSWSTTSFAYGADTLSNSKSYFAQYFPKISFSEVQGNNDAATQAGQIDDLVAQGINVLIVSPVDAAAVAPAVSRAIAAGIKVIASDRNVTGVTGLSTYIGADNVDTGITAGKYAAQLLNGTGKIIEISGSLGASPTIDRAAGFRQALTAFPNIKIIDSKTGNYDQATALKVAEDFLQKYPAGSFNLFFAHGDQMALAAIQAVKEAGRTKDVQVVGVDDSGPAIQAILAGDYAGAAAYPLTYQEHAVAAAKLCGGETVPARIKMDSMLVTKDNASSFLPGW
jgi:ribose transport system substrate-binding protein